MGFLKPKTPKVIDNASANAPAAPTPANPAIQADATNVPTAGSNAINPGSLISTGSAGLTRKAQTQKPSLIGGSGSAN